MSTLKDVKTNYLDLGGPLHQVDFGGSGPPIVMVHGLGGSHANWLAVGGLLAELGHARAIDLPGFGRSPVGSRRAVVPDYVALLARFLREHVGKPAVVIGNSMGGVISLRLAAEHPGLVSALVLSGAPLPAPWTTKRDREVMTAFAIYMVPGLAERVMKKLAEGRTPAREVREILGLCGVDADKLSPEIYAAHLALARDRRGFPWTRSAFLTAARSLVPIILKRADMQRAIRSVKAPTLILQGTADRLVPVESAEATKRLRPDFELEILPGRGHIPMLEAPDEFASHIEAFMRRLRLHGAADQAKSTTSGA